jgi:PAS domain S-box-containing protein
VPVGVLLVDPADRILRANPEFCRIFGFAAEALLGRTPAELIVPDVLRAEAAAQGRKASQGETVNAETICRRRDGSLLDVALRRIAVRLQGEVAGQYVILQDISARKRMEAEHWQARGMNEPLTPTVGPFLARDELRGGSVLDRVEEALQGEGNAEMRLDRLARSLVVELADSCIVYLWDGVDAVRRVAVACADPGQEELLLEQLANYPPVMSRLIPPVAEAFRSGEPQLVPEVTIRALKAIPGDREHVSVALLMGLNSLLVAPLLVDGTAAGAISLATAESGRQYDAEDRALAVSIAERAARTIH